MKQYKYVLVNGYTSTGSSAVLDLLSEYKGVFVPNKEFRIIKDPHGVYDLDKALNCSTDLLNEDIAAREFLWLVNKYSKDGSGFRTTGLHYTNEFGIDFKRLSESYIEDLTSHKYCGYWWYLNLDRNVLECFIQKVLKKLKIYDYRKHSTMRLFLQSEEEFLKKTKTYINNIFTNLNLPEDVSIIALDQAIPATHPGLAMRYFDDVKVINVERDPRSVYTDLITEEKRNGDIVGHVGFDIAETHNVDLFVEWYLKCRKPGMQGDALNIFFEDVILNYDETVRQIEEYIGIESKMHIAPLSHLKPEVSRKNVRYWDRYDCQDEIKIIEQKLSGYINKKL